MPDARKKWEESRAKMVDALETLFCFDYGLTSGELHAQVAWVVDEVFRPEFEKVVGSLGPESWSVLHAIPGMERSVVEAGLTKAQAFELIARLSAEKNGKYWLQRE